MTTLKLPVLPPIRRHPSATLAAKSTHPDWVLVAELSATHWVVMSKVPYTTNEKTYINYDVGLWNNLTKKLECRKFSLHYGEAHSDYLSMISEWSEYLAQGFTL